MIHVWLVLGFTYEDIVGAGQDRRLAQQCVSAWRAAGRPASFQILEAVGTGDHMLHWFVNDTAAAVLDGKAVAWRARVIDERSFPPASARDALNRSSA